MKKNVSIFLFLMLVLMVRGQKQNGWEFLAWGTDSLKIQEVLISKKLVDNESTDPRFEYQDMYVWPSYKNHHLNKVQQWKSFGVNQKDEAQQEYEKICARLVKTYGPVTTEKKDTTKEVITLDWDLKYTRIHLEYDYKYKIIDELGAGSYWVDIVFEAK